MVESRFANKQEDITVNKEGPSQIQEETDRKKRVLKENLRQLYFPGKRIFNTSLFIVGLAFIANAVLLYVDTLTTILHADIFFGFSKQGRNDHLQRSSAVLGFVVGMFMISFHEALISMISTKYLHHCLITLFSKLKDS